MMRRLRPRHDDAGFSLVELLVVISILAVVSTAVVAVILSTQRAEQFQSRLQEVIDDGRLSLSRIRQEVRSARRVLPTSCVTPDDPANCFPSGRLHFWVDRNQDALVEADELVCYQVQVDGVGPGQHRLMRWDESVAPCDGPVPAAARVLAATLVDPLPFKVFDAVPLSDPEAAPTRRVEVVLELEVLGDRGPDSITVDGTIRLRNVE